MTSQSKAYSLTGKRVWVAGHRGMVGSAIVRRLSSEGCGAILVAERSDLDLKRQRDVEEWVAANKPDAVFLAAARVGGILANSEYPAEFLFDNLMLEANIINAAASSGVEKLLFLGSSCIYPRLAPQPIPEAALLEGPLEPTNEWYAIAKIAGIKLCQAYRRQYGSDFISAMPTNLFGPGDNYDLSSSHVIPALIRKTHDAKVSRSASMTIWGSGLPLREFMHVDDCADALVFLMKSYSDELHVNVGSGEELSIAELARLVMQVIGYEGKLAHDLSKPDGTPRKLMSTQLLRELGWRPSVGIERGLRSTYDDWLRHGGSDQRREHKDHRTTPSS